ncbi:hypothetical protein HAT86_12060 [Roseovarius gahaiensis]|uniref:Uncharacterized protein n=1 Tax=Roseovarius gahaiensis TaxID=2716691 RepID=A0A967BER2_9RHOB|nr:hypothetical protein [Roseovarius gahaiensis]NHQ75190.1 hypothetical protein [Roseovarius gahaiensis]
MLSEVHCLALRQWPEIQDTPRAIQKIDRIGPEPARHALRHIPKTKRPSGQL